MPSYDARMIPNSNIPNGPVRENCLAHQLQITTIGRDKGEQVRLERYAPDGVTLLDFALYTVIALHDEDPNVVFVGYRDPESTFHDLRKRLGLSSTDAFIGKMSSQVTDAQISESGGFVERLIDNGSHQGLIVIAPHGGFIEQYTDGQAERVREKLASRCISVWMCQGFKDGGGAYDRWHITSTRINQKSFPKLETVIARGFKYAVAFHGWDENFICIGGSAQTDLKQQIRTAVESAVLGSGIVVATDEDGGCPPGFNGSDPNNIVNRLGANGIQIEQSLHAREQFGLGIAEAVAKVMLPRIEVCTAPVFEGSNFWRCLIWSIRDCLLAISRTGILSLRCEMKRLWFRLRNCRKGNTNPCIEL